MGEGEGEEEVKRRCRWVLVGFRNLIGFGIGPCRRRGWDRGESFGGASFAAAATLVVVVVVVVVGGGYMVTVTAMVAVVRMTVLVPGNFSRRGRI